jgi:VCBS repeat-containing protein
MPRLRLFAITAVLLAGLSAPRLRAATITVNSILDTIAVDGNVTLREAMFSIVIGANVNADVAASGTYGTDDTIDFSILVGPQTIVPTSPLPTITKAMTIDGTTQPGFAGQPLIQLQGNFAGATTDGLTLSNHTGSVIRGLVIFLFGGNGILVSGVGGGHTIAGNWIGLPAAGTGNFKDGIRIEGVPNNVVGGTTAADRNLIDDNGQSNVFAGVEIRDPGATGNVVEGNFIGVDASGTAGVGNSKTFGYGVVLVNGANGNTIGGTAPGAGNVISANGQGVLVQSSNDNIIAGNLIGTNAAGTGALPNLHDGIGIIGTAAGNLVGGTTAAARNVISGNTGNGVSLTGCEFSGSGNAVKGNFIGVDVSSGALGNGGDGVRVDSDQHDGEISGNQIALNTGNGVGIHSDDFCGPVAHGMAILGNRIHHNGLLGIDLGLDGVTANDALDADPGVNGLQNFPVLTSAASNGISITVAGTFDGAANGTFRLEFFTVPSCDASGNGEGQNFMGFHDVTTDGSGHAAFSFPFPAPPFLNTAVTATATSSAGDTSEFSACAAVAVVADNPPAAVDDAYATAFETVLNVPAPGVLGNDSDPDGDAITALLDADAAHGSLVLNADGSFTYTPDVGFSGIDTFTYHATDGALDSNVATVTITVAPPLGTGIPTLGTGGLLALALSLAGAAFWLVRRG